jgi:hypothetical protein
MPLDRDRDYAFELRVDGQPATGGTFTSPLGDEKWTSYIETLNRATSAGDDAARETQGPLIAVRDVGRKFHEYLTQLSPALTSFLVTERGPRRLVIESAHNEIHKLPWEAIVRPDWTIPADDDLSIVHTRPLFRADPMVCPTPLRIAAVFGPHTGRTTADALAYLNTVAAKRIDVTNWQTAKASEVPDADIYHVEAHGHRESGAIDIEYELRSTTPFADRLRNRRMILLWSCHSSLARSWGSSPAFLLNDRANALVVAFQTELHEDAAANISRRFYEDVFANREIADPETAIVRARSRLYHERLNSCEWAALSIWLRQPVDVSAAVLDGPRLPETSWIDAPVTPDQQLLATVLAEEAHPGRPVLFSGVKISAPLSRELVAAYRGRIVHLDGALRSGTGLADVVKALGSAAPYAHPADGVLLAMEELARVPESLLLWTGIGDTQQRLFGLIPIPPGLRIVLTSPYSLASTDGVFQSKYSFSDQPPPGQAPELPLELIERLELAGRYLEGYHAWDGQTAAASSWTSDDQRRFWIAGYWICVRLEHELSTLEWIVQQLVPIGAFDAALLEGNLRSRGERDDLARRRYEDAFGLASSDTDRARVRIEMAYLASRLGDVPLAEAHYRAAIRLLEGVADGDSDPRWRSALGRGLRDYAHLIARDKSRASEARSRINRAIAIHAVDGRINQLAAALTTCGRLEAAMGRLDFGERALIQAAGIQYESGNLHGWASSVQDLAAVNLEAGRCELALHLLASVFTRLDTSGDPLLRSAAGMVAYVAARAAWRLGRFGDTRTWIKQSLDRLSPERRDERVELERLMGVAQSLTPDWESSGG